MDVDDNQTFDGAEAQDYIHVGRGRSTLPGLLLTNTEIVVVDLRRAQWKVPVFHFTL